MGKEWPWPGSRWWKCDLHLHTPESYDFEDRETVTPEQWVAAALGKGLEVVAVTDHNTGKHIPKILQAAAGHDLHVFPGVEITANGGAHLLTLFDIGRGEDAVTMLLSLCGISDQQMGRQEACAACSFEDALARAASRGGLNIAAHVDGKDGFLKLFGPGQSAQRILRSEHLHAVEVKLEDSTLLGYLDNTKTGYDRPLGPLPRLTFSDAHALSQIGRRYTWVKMTRPSLEGLRLALEDGESSVKPATAETGDPNVHAALVLESIAIEWARFMGRDAPFQVSFNPWLNAIVGGRGTGKSSLVEFLRISLRREDELPNSLRADFATLKKIPQGRHDRGLLLNNTRIQLVYRKDGVRFRIQWDQAGALPAIEAEAPDGSWQPETGEVRGRFPVRIYSQKQVFEIAREPEALLRILDDSAEVDRGGWQIRWDQEKSKFLALRARAREISTRLADQGRLEGELSDVLRKLQIFEGAGHAEVLREFQRRRRQERLLESWEESLRLIGESLRGLVNTLSPAEMETGLFDPSDEADAYLLEASRRTTAQAQDLGRELNETAGRYEALLEEWQQERARWTESATVSRARTSYDALLERLQEESVEDPTEYGRLVQRRSALEQHLAGLAGERRVLAEVEEQSRQALEQLLSLRQELTQRRERFLSEVVGSSPHVRIEVVPYGNEASVETDLPTLLQTKRFENDFRSADGKEGLVPWLYQSYIADYEQSRDPEQREALVDAFLQRLEFQKEELTKIGRRQPSSLKLQDQRFARHLESLQPETFDRLAAWFPDDSLRVTYSRKGDGTDFVPLDQGSPGQKAAAILAFLLSYGREPMVLDQPEDDLDNHLISDLVVRQLRENKPRRQVIVVTHNPNIVVNADAELVLALDFRGGQTRVIQSGGLQEQDVRDEVCRVMEGGREALERRYRRIGRRSGNA